MNEAWSNDTKLPRYLNVLSSCATDYGKLLNVVDKWCAKIILRVHTGNDWNKIVNREVTIMKVKYPFLPERQVMGKAYEKFGIPTIMGSIVRPSVLNLQGGIVKQLFKNQDQKSKMHQTRRSYNEKRIPSKPNSNYFEKNERIFRFVTDSADEGSSGEFDRKPAKMEGTRFSTEPNTIDQRTEKESSVVTLAEEKRMLNELFKSDESDCSEEDTTDHFWYPKSKMIDLRFGSSNRDRFKAQENHRSSNDHDYNCSPASVRSEYLQNSNRLLCEFKKTNLKTYGNSSEPEKICTDTLPDVNKNIVKIRESDLEQDSMSDKPSRSTLPTRSIDLGSRDPASEKEMQFLTISSKRNKNLPPFFVKTKDNASPIYNDFSNRNVLRDISKFDDNSFAMATFDNEEKIFSDLVDSFKIDKVKNRKCVKKTFSVVDNFSLTPIESTVEFSSDEKSNSDFSDKNSNRSLDFFCSSSSAIDKSLGNNYERSETFVRLLGTSLSSIAKIEERIFNDKITIENLQESRAIEIKLPEPNISYETEISTSTSEFDPTMLSNYSCEYDSPRLKRASMSAKYTENIAMKSKNLEDRKTAMRTDIRRKVNRIVSQLDIADYDKI